jgi:hypothetical protein
LESGSLEFDADKAAAPGFTTTIKFDVPLKLTDIIVLE